MTEHQTQNPGAAATASGANSINEAAKLLQHDTPETGDTASRLFVWDRKSNSIQPLCDLLKMVQA